MTTVSNNVLGAAVFVLCLLGLQCFPGMFEFDRQQVLSGEIWRIWTGHLVHTNMLHLLLNIVAALVIYLGFFTRIQPGELLAYGSLFSALISLALLSFLPGLDWYNGLSGLLHALVTCFAIRLAVGGARVYWLWLGAVWLKVASEAASTDLAHASLMGDMNIITEAHLAGAIIGTATGLIVAAPWRGLNRQQPRQST